MAYTDGIPLIEPSLVQWGKVTAVVSATQFQAARLAGYGDTYFNGWTVYVLRKVIGTGAAPQGEQQLASAFLQQGGTVTHTAFTALLLVGDEILMLHPNIGAGVGALISSLVSALGRQYAFTDFWSLPAANITVPNLAGVTDLTFPNIVVAGLPTGLAVKRVSLILAIRALRDTSGAANFIAAANRTLRIKAAAGAWGVNDIVAITFALNSFYTNASFKEAGPVIIGSADLSALVTGNGTYNVRSDQTTRADAIYVTGASLELYDIQVGLRVFYT